MDSQSNARRESSAPSALSSARLRRALLSLGADRQEEREADLRETGRLVLLGLILGKAALGESIIFPGQAREMANSFQKISNINFAYRLLKMTNKIAFRTNQHKCERQAELDKEQEQIIEESGRFVLLGLALGKAARAEPVILPGKAIEMAKYFKKRSSINFAHKILQMSEQKENGSTRENVKLVYRYGTHALCISYFLLSVVAWFQPSPWGSVLIYKCFAMAATFCALVLTCFLIYLYFPF